MLDELELKLKPLHAVQRRLEMKYNSLPKAIKEFLDAHELAPYFAAAKICDRRARAKKFNKIYIEMRSVDSCKEYDLLKAEAEKLKPENIYELRDSLKRELYKLCEELGISQRKTDHAQGYLTDALCI